MVSQFKMAGMVDATRKFFGDAVSPVPAQGAAGVAQKLFSNRVKPSDTRVFSRVNFGNAIRDAVFGSPIDVAREMRRYGRVPGGGFNAGQALKRYYYRSVVPTGVWKNKTPGMKALSAGVTAMNVAMPAMEMYGAATAPRENRGESIGRAAASVLSTPFTMRLGLPGSLINSATARAGGAVGRLFDPKQPVQPPAPQVPFHNG